MSLEHSEASVQSEDLDTEEDELDVSVDELETPDEEDESPPGEQIVFRSAALLFWMWLNLRSSPLFTTSLHKPGAQCPAEAHAWTSYGPGAISSPLSFFNLAS